MPDDQQPDERIHPIPDEIVRAAETGDTWIEAFWKLAKEQMEGEE